MLKLCFWGSDEVVAMSGNAGNVERGGGCGTVVDLDPRSDPSPFLRRGNAGAAVEWLRVERCEWMEDIHTAVAASAGGAGVCLERV